MKDALPFSDVRFAQGSKRLLIVLPASCTDHAGVQLLLHSLPMKCSMFLLNFTPSIPLMRWNSCEVFTPCLLNAVLNVIMHGRAERLETTHGWGIHSWESAAPARAYRFRNKNCSSE